METEYEAVQRFTGAMVEKLGVRRVKYKPFGWRDPKYKTVDGLMTHLDMEIEELKYALRHLSWTEVMKEFYRTL